MKTDRQMTRVGAYGIVMQDGQLLCNLKKGGPYVGLWDLPGGGIEFGETPEVACRRELMEECGMETQLKFLYHTSFTFSEFNFHQIGFIYEVLSWKIVDTNPEEENRWFTLNDLKKEEFTPFANEAIHFLKCSP